MSQITLIGKSYAEVGREFYFMGPLQDCDECKLKGVCFGLETGARYRIVEVRGQSHNCPEHLDDTVTAVKVEKVPTPAAVPKKLAMDGSVVTFQEPKCENIGCPNYRLCHAVGKISGEKYAVSNVQGDLECLIGEKMVRVDLL